MIPAPRDPPGVRTAPGQPPALRLALQAEGHQPHRGQHYLHPVTTSRSLFPQVVPAVAGRPASAPSGPAGHRGSPRSPRGAPVGPPGGRSPTAPWTRPPAPAPATDPLPTLGAVGPAAFAPKAPAPR